MNCSIENCSSKVYAKGFCNKHYQRLWKHGDPHYIPIVVTKSCEVAGCSGEYHGRGYCYKHYERWRLYGDAENGKSDYVQPKGKGAPAYKHGLSHHPLYHVWSEMKERCYNKTNKNYHAWGGRNVTVCERWRKNVANFISDMGDRPDGHSIDRINNDGNYEPINCRWADATTQARNRRSTKLTIEKAEEIRSFRQEGLTLAKISEIVGFGEKVIHDVVSNKTWRSA